MTSLAKNVRVIPALNREQRRTLNRLLRVAAYCRVSTDSEEQMTSYINQLEFYTQKINENPAWDMVEVFADEGTTGTNTKHRKEFNRMMELCKKGKIDLILTKSIARFARNTLDSIQYVRMLRQIGVTVVFEQEGINSLDPESEQMLTMYASMAQNESQNLSKNVKWGVHRNYANGKVGCMKTLGYKKGDDGQLCIVPEQAETVKLVFQMYLDGASYSGIAKELERLGATTIQGKKKWRQGVIDYMLSNEKYIGDALLQKTFIEDFLSKNVKKNTGFLPQYYVSNNHPPIISRDVFKRVQYEKTRRRNLKATSSKKAKTKVGKYSSKYALTEIMICGECASPYRRVTWSRNGIKRIVWRCINRLDYGTRYCQDSPTLKESDLHKTILSFINQMADSKETLRDMLAKYCYEVVGDGQESNRKKQIQQRLEELRQSINEYVKPANRDGESNSKKTEPWEFQKINHEFKQLKSELDKLQEHEDAEEMENASILATQRILSETDFTATEFDDTQVRQIIEQVIVLSEDKIRIRVKGGFEKDMSIIQS